MEARKRGRPLRYKTAEELQAAVDAYFESCRGEYRKDDTGGYVLDHYGLPILDGAVPYTITGLTYALGFRSRQTFCNYKGRREFSDIIQRARLMVENYAETRLYDKNGYSGAAWVLSTAFGWEREAASNNAPAPTVNIIAVAG